MQKGSKATNKWKAFYNIMFFLYLKPFVLWLYNTVHAFLISSPIFNNYPDPYSENEGLNRISKMTFLCS